MALKALNLFESILVENVVAQQNIDYLTLTPKLYESLQSSNLRALVFDGSISALRIDDTYLSCIVTALLGANINLEIIGLKNNRITSVGVERDLAKLIPGGRVKVVDLLGNDIDGSSLHCLGLGNSDSTICSLNLSFNHSIGRVGGMVVAEGLQKNKRLRELFLNSCGLDLTTLIAIVSSLAENQCMETLELDRPLLQNKEEEECNHLSRILLHAKSLSKLSLRYSSIRDHGACLLAESLFRNSRIRSLNLECNRIGVAGAEALASYLITVKNTGLDYLYLAYNEVGNAGCIALAEALETNTNLKILSLKSNKIDSALVDMGNALSRNNTLQRLSLFGNSFDQSSGKIFADLIERRLPYVDLSLDFTVYVVDGKYMIAEKS